MLSLSSKEKEQCDIVTLLQKGNTRNLLLLWHFKSNGVDGVESIR